MEKKSAGTSDKERRGQTGGIDTAEGESTHRAGPDQIQNGQAASPVEPYSVVSRLSNAVRSLSKSSSREERTGLLMQMQEAARALRLACESGDLAALATFSSALGKLFGTLSKDPDKVTPSALRTISHAIDFLGQVTTSGVCLSSTQSEPLRILVVDDDEICRRTLLLALRSSDVELTACDSAEKALASLGASQFDVIFTDIMMPVKDGFALATELRQLPGHAATPVIFVTALSDFVTRSRSIMSGGCDLIAKPFTVGEIVVKAFTFGLKYRFAKASKPAENGASHPPELESIGSNGHSAHPQLSGPADEPAVATGFPPAPPRVRLNGVICLDELGAIKSINKDGADIFGYASDQVVGWPISRLIPDDLPAGESAMTLGKLLAGDFKTKRQADFSARRQDASTFRISVSVSAIESQGKHQFIALVRPVEEVTNPAPIAAPEPAVEQSPAPPSELSVPPAIEFRLPPDSELARPQHRNTLLVGGSSKRSESSGSPEASPQQTLISAALTVSTQSPALPGTEGASANPARVQELERAVRETESQLSKLNEELLAKQSLLKNEQTLRDQVEVQLKEVSAHYAEIELELKEQNDYIAELRHQKEQWESCAQLRAARLAELSADLEKEMARRAQLEEQAALAGQEEKTKISDQAEQAERELRTAKETLEKQVQEQISALSQLESALRAEEAERRQAAQTAAELATTKVRLEAELAQYASRAQQWDQDHQALEELLRGETELREQVSAQLAEAMKLREQAEAEAAALKAESASQRQQLAAHPTVRESSREQTAALRQELESVTQQLSQLRGRVTELARQKEEWERRAAELERARELMATAPPAHGDSSPDRRQLELAANELQAAQCALSELTSRHAKLQGELVSSQQAQSSLQRKIEELDSSQQAVHAKLAAARSQLLAEGSQRQRLEARIKELEHAKAELAQQTEGARTRDALWQQNIQSLRAELDQSRAALDKQKGEQTAREGDLKEQCAVLEAQAQSLEDSSAQLRSQLKNELDQRLAAEKKGEELLAIRISLEQEVARRTRSEEELRRSLTEAQQAATSACSKVQELEAASQAVSGKLAALRSQLAEETARRQRLDLQVKELEQAKADLTRQTETAAEREQLWQQTIQSLQTELEQTRARLEKEIHEQSARENELQDLCAKFEQQARALDESLADTRRQLDRETAQRTAAELTVRDLTVIRTALEQEVTQRQRTEERLRREFAQAEQRLQQQVDSLAAQERQLQGTIQDLQAAEQTRIRESRRDMASLRYSVLDAMRVRAQIGSGYVQSARQSLDHLKQITTALLTTPLSSAQRQLANSLKTAVEDSLRDHSERNRADALCVEPLVEQVVEFSPRVMLAEALDGIKVAAGEAGASVQTALTGSAPEQLMGNAAHIYQLLTLWANSLRQLPHCQKLDIEVALAAGANGSAQARFVGRVTVPAQAQELAARLADVTDAKALQLNDLSEAESGLAVSWQLAQALEGTAQWEQTSEAELFFEVVLPLQAAE